MGSTTDPAVSFHHVSKRFPGARALDDVSFDVARGSCHALCGENGAGKSTLGKILAGIEVLDAGELRVDGRTVAFSDPRDALAAGIGMVHQELAFCENLSVAENLCLGDLPRRGPGGLFLARGEMVRRARAMMAAIEAPLDVTRLVGDLTVAEQQMVQIAAAVGSGARVIIFDEPSSSLSQHEAEHLYALVERLRARAVTCVYVSHRMPEIFRLCDTITVLRDGRHVATRPRAALDEAQLVQLMIGRQLEDYLPGSGARLGRGAGEPRSAAESDIGSSVARSEDHELLRVDALTSPRKFQDVSFRVHAGEVVGLAGLVGAGRSDVAKALFGLDPEATGRVMVDGLPLPLGSAAAAMQAGLGFVPEDRKRQGLVLGMRALANVTLPVLPRLARNGWIRAGAERALADDAFARLGVRPPDLGKTTMGLSGGNQQKLVLARWLAARCRVLILDEPTRGVDVGAKAEIHAVIAELAAEGTGILLISSELPELVALSTRLLVLRDGRLVGALGREAADQETLMRLMAGLDPGETRLRT